MIRTLFIVLGFIAITSAGVSNAQTIDPSAIPKQYPWDQRPRKCFAPGAEALWTCKPQPDWPSYGETKQRVDRLIVVDPDFDLIQRAESELGFSQKQFPTGQYYFDAWFLSLDGTFGGPYEHLSKVKDAWAKAKGEEGYVKLAEALLCYSEAWQARGSGYANTVLPEAWEIYRRKLREADRVLDSASDRLKHTGPWHVMKLRIAYQLPEISSEARAALLDRASRDWPDYQQIYTTAMGFSLPRWGGSYEEVDRIARFAVKNSSDRLGTALYPAVYESVFRLQCDCTLRDSSVEWDLMKKGFRDVEARGRADVQLWKNYARLACQMRDRPEARRLFEVSDKLKPVRTAEPPDPCREFAFSPT